MTSSTPARRSAAPRPARGARRRLAVLLVAGLVATTVALLAPTAAVAQAPTATDRLVPGQTLRAGSSLTSPDGRYRLAMQTDGNLVLYAPGRPMWATMTSGAGNALVMQTDGNLVLYTGAGRPAWATFTGDGQDLLLQSDGNLVLYTVPTSPRRVAWTTGTPNANLGPGQSLTTGDVLMSTDGRYRWSLASTGDAVLTGPGRTLWSTGTAGRTGTAAAPPVLVMQTDGNLVLYSGGRAVWNSGTSGQPGANAVVGGARVQVVLGTTVLWSSPVPSTLAAGAVLAPGEALVSPSGRYALVTQQDGNLVLYGPGGASWATGTFGPGAGLVLQGDGNLVQFFTPSQPVWWSGTSGAPPGQLRMQDDGHLVLYAASGAAVWSMWARSAGITAAVGAAAAFGAGSGERTAVAVLDRATGLVYTAGDADASYASASLVKVFIAARLLSQNAQADPATADLMWRMITLSDDDAATALWPRAGGAGVTDWVQQRYGISGLGPPTTAGWWGLTQVSATAMVRFYAAVATDPAVGPWLMNAMANAANAAADGWNQWFGIPSATSGWRVKQGWMCCLDTRSRLHSTGFVGGDRYTVAILTDGPTAFYGQRGADVVTGAAQRLLPGGTMPA